MNGFTSFAIPAYIISVTVVEAFVNEMFIRQAGRSYFNGSESGDFWQDVERKELIEKLVVLPKKIFWLYSSSRYATLSRYEGSN